MIADHFAVVGVEGLFDQRELFLSQTALDLHQVAENPRFVLQFKIKIDSTIFNLNSLSTANGRLAFNKRTERIIIHTIM